MKRSLSQNHNEKKKMIKKQERKFEEKKKESKKKSKLLRCRSPHSRLRPYLCVHHEDAIMNKNYYN